MVTKMLQIYVLNCYSDQIRVGKFFFSFSENKDPWIQKEYNAPL